MHERAMQALLALTLDPVAEATGDRALWKWAKHRHFESPPTETGWS